MLDALELHRQAQRGALLLTPNVRSARQVRSRIVPLAADSAEAGRISERVLPWRAWTTRLWHQMVLDGRDERVLLQPLQEKLLWEQILDSDPDVEKTDALLGLCQSASSLLSSFAAATTGPEWQGAANADVSRFARWRRVFQQHCDRERLLPSADLELALAAHAATLPVDSIALCGLAGLTRAQEKLLAVLANSGSTIVETGASASSAAAILLQCEDDPAELHALGEHLARLLGSDLRPSIAVIVPDLSSVRDRIERTLREHLPSSSAADTFVSERRPLWEFSTGRPLASFGVIADALHLLAWTVRDLQAEEASLVVRSRHFSWPVNAESAASLDAALLRRKPHLSGTWSARAVARLFESSNPAMASVLTDRTRGWSGLRHSSSTFTGSAERARRVLRDFDWLRSGDRSSVEFQAVKRFESLLDDLAALNVVSADQVAWPDFVRRLTAAARATSFAPENTGAPIQILTPDESTGIEADEVWFLHADEDRWTSHAAVHPLLPIALQRHYGMPGTQPALDEQRHREQTSRLAGIAPAITFSFAQRSDSGEQRPAAAVAALPSIQHVTATDSGHLRQIQASAALQTFEDGDLIPVRLHDNMAAISGGVSTLQSQAACAFRAFAERRLGSATLDSRDLGMDARDRGSLLHNALQIFWDSTKTSSNLQALIREDRLLEQIYRSVDLALRAERDPADHWSEAYLEIQRTRLEGLLLRWLKMEAKRPPFEVAHLERSVDVTVAGLPLKVRVDRVDRVTLPGIGTAHVIVDYKTGDPSARKWEGERPDEPQLPLYATSAMTELADTTETPVAAIAFGVVRAGDKLSFVSEPRKSAWLVQDPKANPSTLESELESWRHTLESLAYEFSSGIARVGPKEYPSTCRYCEQRLLCRLNPALLESEGSAEVDA